MALLCNAAENIVGYLLAAKQQLTDSTVKSNEDKAVQEHSIL